MPGTVAIYTLGCKVNQYESRALAETLLKEGVREVSSGADACVVNTCAVTAESERKARQTVRRAISENPGAYILVTGCAAQVSPGSFSAIPGVDYVNGNREKKALAELILRYLKSGEKTSGARVPDLLCTPYEPMEVSSSERTRAYMKVEDGCESRCAYCIIPRARGPVVSRPLDDCVCEARRLVRAGYKEIVLTAIELSAYGRDLGRIDAGDLVAALEEVEGLERLRFPSIDPSFLRPPFVDRVAGCGKLAHHFHLSLQSGCDETLRRMRRPYDRAHLTRNIGYLMKTFPDVRFTADVIVGFPGETDDEYAHTKEFLSGLPLLHTHVFAFSKRPGTEAYSMPGQVDEQVKKERVKDLIAFTDGIRDRMLEKEEGAVYDVLFESGGKGRALGHTGNFIEVAVPYAAGLQGKLLPVRLGNAEDGVVCGVLLPEK